jgi:hypothetical protein
MPRTKRVHEDYVYRNSDDSVRFRVFRRDEGERRVRGWDIDFFEREAGGFTTNYTSNGAELPFRTKIQALRYLNECFGALVCIQVDRVTEGWESYGLGYMQGRGAS